jgi:hypothetical protein
MTLSSANRGWASGGVSVYLARSSRSVISRARPEMRASPCHDSSSPLDDERRRMALGRRVAPEVGRLPGPRHHAERYVAGRGSELEATETRRAVPAQRRDRLVLVCVEDPLHSAAGSGSESTTSCQRAIGSSGPRADARTARCYRRKRVDQAGRPTECRETGWATPFRTTEPIGVKATSSEPTASTTPWVTSTCPGSARSATLAATFTVRPK